MCFRSDGSGVPISDPKAGVITLQQFGDLFEARLSRDRIRPYVSATDGSVERVVALYEWNLSASAEVLKIIAVVEVVLRNSISSSFESFSRSNSGDGFWLSDSRILPFARQRDAVEHALKKVTAQNREPTLSAVIPELSFGFWRFLLTKRYGAMFWSPVLQYAFPEVRHGAERALFDRVGRLHRLRNRIAHHEPIFGRRLDLDHRDCLLVLGAVCPVTAKWAEGISRIPEVLANTPLLR